MKTVREYVLFIACIVPSFIAGLLTWPLNLVTNLQVSMAVTILLILSAILLPKWIKKLWPE